MSAVYSQSETQYLLISGQPIFEIVSVPAGYPKLKQVHFTFGTPIIAQNYAFGLGIPAAAGISPVSSRYLVPEELAPSPQVAFTRIVSDWNVAPTAPTTFQRRWTFPLSAVGGLNAIPMRFHRAGLIVPNGQTMVLWCITAALGNFVTANFVFED